MTQSAPYSFQSKVMSDANTSYALGYADQEHERLIRQARWLTHHTERCFREAGIGLGQRVLDLGPGHAQLRSPVTRVDRDDVVSAKRS